jgi:HEAT repeat protein
LAFRKLQELKAKAEPAVPKLIEALHDPDASIRRDAATLLNSIGPPAAEAVAPLFEAIRDDDSTVPFDAVLAIRNILGKCDETLPTLVVTLKAGTLSERRLAALRLEDIHPLDKRVVPELAEALKSEDAVVQILVAWCVRSMGEDASDAVPALLEVAQEKEKPVRRAAFAALAHIVGPQHKEVMPLSLDALWDDDFATRLEARSVLPRLGRNLKYAVPKFEGILRSNNIERHTSVVFFLGQLGKDAQSSVPLLLDCLEHGHSESDRAAIIEALVRIDPEYRDLAVPIFTPRLTQKDPTFRHHAHGWIREFDTSVAIPCLVAALKDGNERIRGEVAQTLGEMGAAAKAALPALAESLKESGERTRMVIAVAIAKIQPSSTEALRVLTLMFSHPDEHVRHRAAESLRELGPSAAPAVPTLIRALSDHEAEWVRAEVCYALREIGPAAEAAITALRREMSRGVQYSDVAAAGALAKLSPKDKRPVEYLIKALEERDVLVRPIAARCLGALGPAAARAVPELTHAFDDTEGSVREAIVEALGQIGSQVSGVVPALIKALEDKDQEVRVMAIKTLASFGTTAKDAVPPLKGLLNDEEVLVRTAAADALQKIDSQ